MPFSTSPGRESPGFIYTLHGPLRHHTFSTVLLFLWMGFIAFSITIQELAIRHSRTLPPHRPSYSYSTLPFYSVLRTVFAQVHGPITGIHLARLAVGSLHTQYEGGPRTWIELFWLADRRWSGPVGVSYCLWTTTRRRMSISKFFIALCALSLIALATPIFFSRAYEAQKTGSGERYAASTMSAISLESLASGSAQEQLELGWRRWRGTDGASVVELFPRTTYVAQSQGWNSSAGDLMFAGELLGNDARQTGVRLRGACVPIGAAAELPIDMTTFRQYCEQNLGNLQHILGQLRLATEASIAICSSVGLAQTLDNNLNQTSSVFIWFNTTTSISQDCSGSVTPTLVPAHGVIRCDSSTSIGDAFLTGDDLTFREFSSNQTFSFATNNTSPVLNPIAALFAELDASTRPSGGQNDDSDDDDNDDDDVHPLVTALLNSDRHCFASTDAQRSTSLLLASQLWTGLTLTLAPLLATPAIQKPLILPASLAPPLIRDYEFFYAMLALLGAWLIGMVILTAMFLRPTMSDSLDAYTAARLLVAQGPSHVQDELVGTLEQDQTMMEPFSRVEVVTTGRGDKCVATRKRTGSGYETVAVRRMTEHSKYEV